MKTAMTRRSADALESVRTAILLPTAVFACLLAACVGLPVSHGQPAAPPAGIDSAPPFAPQIAPAEGGQANGQRPEVLEAGPVHEAFAAPTQLDARPAATINREPPTPVQELPPEVRPDGANIAWIPGYWGWSEEKSDFVWVSGVWRDTPPGRRWVPGYWTQVAGGWQWIAGMWAPAEQTDLSLLPNPPASLESGPTSPAPGENYFWVPGCWVNQNANYIWRPGYWNLGQADWIWTPDHYCYTPRGSIFIAGFWDRPLLRRGLLYAPVWWRRGYVGGYGYRPNYIINPGLLLSALFWGGNQHCYYYGHGNWYNSHYRPWYAGYGGGGMYNSIYAYHRWHDGHNRDDWHDNVAGQFHQRQHDFDHGAAGHWDGNRDGKAGAAAEGPGHGLDRDGDAGAQLVASADAALNNRGAGAGFRDAVRLRSASSTELSEAGQQVRNWRQLGQSRLQQDGNVAAQLGGVARTHDGSLRLGADTQLEGRLGNTLPQRGTFNRRRGAEQFGVANGQPNVEGPAGANGQVGTGVPGNSGAIEGGGQVRVGRSVGGNGSNPGRRFRGPSRAQFGVGGNPNPAAGSATDVGLGANGAISGGGIGQPQTGGPQLRTGIQFRGYRGAQLGSSNNTDGALNLRTNGQPGQRMQGNWNRPGSLPQFPNGGITGGPGNIGSSAPILQGPSGPPVGRPAYRPPVGGGDSQPRFVFQGGGSQFRFAPQGGGNQVGGVQIHGGGNAGAQFRGGADGAGTQFHGGEGGGQSGGGGDAFNGGGRGRAARYGN